jgi:hypothetical protein
MSRGMSNFKISLLHSLPVTVLILFSGFLAPTFSQQAGEVRDQEFVIRKDRVLTLPQKPRRFEKIPVLPTPKSGSRFDYLVQPYFLSLQPEVIRPEAAQRQWPRKLEEDYPGFLRLGYGNYASPIFEARYNYTEEEDYNIGALIKHEGFYTGPVGGSNSAENFTSINLDGSLYRDFFQIYGGIDYDRHHLNFYGYDPLNEILADYVPNQNTLNTFKLRAGIQDIEKMDSFNYDAGIFIRTFNDRYLASETELGMKAYSDFWFDDDLSTGIHMDLSLTQPQDELYNDINRNYFKVNPFVQYRKSGIYVKAGANMVIENDVTFNKTSDFHVFPQVDAHYMIADEFGVYAGFEGDVIRNTYLDFVTENPFLGPSENLLNIIQNYRAKAGIKGVLNDEMTYEVGAAVGKFSNMHFFINSPTDSLRFNVVYDDDTRLINYQAKFGWHVDKTFRLMASADYYFYNTSQLAAAFLRPEWEIKINNNYSPVEELLIQFNANMMGGLQGLVDFGPEETNLSTLPVIVDLQFKADYQISERVSAFAVGNNLLNRNNQRFLNYPVRGIQGILGITLKF